MRRPLLRVIGIFGLVAAASAAAAPHARAAAGTPRSVSAGGYHSCIVETHHDVDCWGRNEFGQAAPPGVTSQR